jgi:hypothetical protein
VAHSCNPVIQRLRQEEHEIENILGCTGRHWLNKKDKKTNPLWDAAQANLLYFVLL